MKVNPNASAYNALRTVDNANSGLSKGIERLSSSIKTERTESVADSLAVSSAQRYQNRQQNAERSNAQDGVVATTIATTALNDTKDVLQKLRSIAESAGGAGNSAGDIEMLNKEIRDYTMGMDHGLRNISFQGKKLFGGSDEGQNSTGGKVGSNLNLGKLNAETLGIDKIDLTTQSSNEAMATIDSALEKVSDMLKNVSVQRESFTKALQASTNDGVSKIKDADMAKETAALVKNQMLKQADTAVLAQSNQTPQNVLSLLK